MAECNHVFIGRSDGVHCTKCGLHMRAAEYCEYCFARELASHGDKDATQFVADVDAGEYVSETKIPRITTETVQKRKRTRKKKEDTVNE
jgi:hypothetical protein